MGTPRSLGRMGARSIGLPGLVVLSALLGACRGQTEGTSRRTGRVIYGSDDRIEYFEAAQPERQRAMSSLVALIPKTWIASSRDGLTVDVLTLAQADGLCPGEAFADQPAAAFCSGVLVDWDLVLTAGHCVRYLPLDGFVVVRGYYYAAPNQMTIAPSDVRDVDAIVDEALDPAGSDPRLDFAWVRLAAPVSDPWEPAPIDAHPEAFALDDPVISIGTPGGVPLKVDDGGTIRALRPDQLDYFVADTDTSHGSSGGGAFDQHLALAGVLARGGVDLVTTMDGCQLNARIADGAQAEEQFTYAHRALEHLCAAAPSASTLCRAQCGDPCSALAPQPRNAAGGCTVARHRQDAFMDSVSAAMTMALLALLTRRRRGRCHRPGSVR
jgi:hypothetical protein